MTGPAARLVGIALYPVKALAGYPVATAQVEPWGLAGDRRWMVVQPDGRFVTQREQPGMATIRALAEEDAIRLEAAGAPSLRVTRPAADAARREVGIWRDRVPARDAGPDAAAWLTARLGTPAGLVFLADTGARPVDPDFGGAQDRVAFADGFPVLLASNESLAALNAVLPSAVPMSRFRPNLVVEGALPWAEDGWQRIRIGTASFRVAKPCARCAVTTVDQTTGERPDRSEPLRGLALIRRTAAGVMFGQNLIPEVPGRIAVGDAVDILAEGAPNLRLLPAAEED